MFEIDAEVYPLLVQYTTPVKKPVRPIVGRDLQMKQALAAFVRPELCNVLLIAPAGSGKTAFVQGLAQRDSKHIYLEVDLSKMISNLNDPTLWPDDIESLDAMKMRAKEFLVWIRKTYPGQRVLAVGHGIINKAIQSVFFDKPMKEIPPMTNAEIRILDLD